MRAVISRKLQGLGTGPSPPHPNNLSQLMIKAELNPSCGDFDNFGTRVVSSMRVWDRQGYLSAGVPTAGTRPPPGLQQVG